MSYYGWTQQTVEQKIRNHKRFSRLYAVSAFLLLIYSFYLALHSTLSATIVSFLLAVLMGLYAVKTHMDYFRLRHRRLDAPWGAWFSFLIGKNTTSTKTTTKRDTDEN